MNALGVTIHLALALVYVVGDGHPGFPGTSNALRFRVDSATPVSIAHAHASLHFLTSVEDEGTVGSGITANDACECIRKAGYIPGLTADTGVCGESSS